MSEREYSVEVTVSPEDPLGAPEVVALHEAAHVVTYERLHPGSTTRVSIRGDHGGGGSAESMLYPGVEFKEAFKSTKPLEEPDHRRVVEEMIVFGLASGAAIKECVRRNPGRGATVEDYLAHIAGDLEIADPFLRRLFGTDDEYASGLQRLLEEADRLVLENWDAIEAVAALLLENGASGREVTGEQVRQALRAA